MQKLSSNQNCKVILKYIQPFLLAAKSMNALNDIRSEAKPFNGSVYVMPI